MWKKIAPYILRYRFYILAGLILLATFFALNINLKFSKSVAQLLPSSSKEMVDFENFSKVFHKDDNLVVLGLNAKEINSDEKVQKWNELHKKIKQINGIEGVITIADAQKLIKDTLTQSFKSESLSKEINDLTQWNDLQTELKNYPFYDRLLFNSKTGSIQTIVYIESDIVDSNLREQLVFDLNDDVKLFEKETSINVHLSGMPVIRTFNAEQVKGESLKFIGLSLFVTIFLFFLFFRSISMTFSALMVVTMSVLCSFATMSLLGYEITILTALVPPLLIVIGVPNCVFLINKYLQEYKIHQNKMRSLIRMIVRVGTASFMTNSTTAFGFFTFIFTDSPTLKEFGVVASINIVGIFLWSILIVPTTLSYYKSPKIVKLRKRELKWLTSLVMRVQYMVLFRRKVIYLMATVVLIFGLVGIFFMKSSGNMLDDMSKTAEFYHDIKYFDEEFGGILPLDIMISSKNEGRILSASTLNQMDAFSYKIDSMGISSKPLVITDLLKFAKQAYYNNNSDFYTLPSSQERAFVQKYIKNSAGGAGANYLKNFVDSTQTHTRITVLMKNLDSEKLEEGVASINEKLKQDFPEENYNAYLTGGAYLFMKGTEYLTKNLFISLGLAILIIAVIMSVMFRSWKMIIISLAPNILPLIVTAGIMGYFGVGLKPSTILVFGIAFGIAVDDAIHFLSRYRQDLVIFNGNIRVAAMSALQECGISMFSTSIILFLGFFTFTLSKFDGIVSLGGLVSITLVVASLSNLLLLPSLILSNKYLSDKKFIESVKDDDDFNIDEINIPEN